MIAYDLQCSHGHTFEGWFDDETAFKHQQKKGLVTCPVCSDAMVVRIPSTFAIRGASGAGSSAETSAGQAVTAIQHQIAAFVREHFDDVGNDFAKEALKIHYGAPAPRNIRGVSTAQEEKMLRQEGVEFLKIPLPVTPESDA